ncbi:hypothetical protein RJ640_012087 [Escallonia rubra]|uniref:Uncharacterized protein n=1 Tax=Escallonia rubra TaxID=112253 RepID=A0AA88R9M7_9ASTE|nr:hypothetical protein RJ640_012087 [Escallonia rubra]
MQLRPDCEFQFVKGWGFISDVESFTKGGNASRAPLVSTFRLSYYSILNLMSRAEGQFTAENVIRHSFHQFQYEKARFAEYHQLKLSLTQLEKKMMAETTRPERVLSFLLPGRLERDEKLA